MAVTVAQLHALYCAGHAQARALGEPAAAWTVSREVTAAEQLVLELALLDATNGTPARTARAFERALAAGADLFAALGCELDLPALDEAA